jgi:hypothetical protein
MSKWLIDENIFEIADGAKDKKGRDALYFIETVGRFHKIVLDTEGIIMGKYNRFFGKSKLLGSWFVEMYKKVGRIEYSSSSLSSAISLKLDSLGFDPDDKCYIGPALKTDKLIASEDSDFRKDASIESYFKNDLGIEVLDIETSNTIESTRR